MKKLYSLTVKTGEYQKDGQTKGRYKTVGALMEKDGKKFILLDRTFNPAGINSDRDTILISLFEEKAPESTEEVPFA